MKTEGLSVLQKFIAYSLFISIVVRFVACQLTKNYTSQQQLKTFRYYSYTGFIGAVIALSFNMLDVLPRLLPLIVWLLLFVVANFLERRFKWSKLF